MNEQRQPRLGPVRVTMPAIRMHNIGDLHKTMADIAERLGCPKCVSGADCTFALARNFTVNPELRAEPTPLPWGGQTVTFNLSQKVSGDINAMKKVVEVIVGRLGCGPCHSGYDIAFRDFMENDPAAQAQLEINKMGGMH